MTEPLKSTCRWKGTKFKEETCDQEAWPGFNQGAAWAGHCPLHASRAAFDLGSQIGRGIGRAGANLEANQESYDAVSDVARQIYREDIVTWMQWMSDKMPIVKVKQVLLVLADQVEREVFYEKDTRKAIIEWEVDESERKH